MLRYGRKMKKYLRNRALRRLMRKRWTHQDDQLTTRQRKRVRQILRRMESARGTADISSRVGQSWEHIFLLARKASDDFMIERADKSLQGREADMAVADDLGRKDSQTNPPALVDPGADTLGKEEQEVDSFESLTDAQHTVLGKASFKAVKGKVISTLLR